MDRYGIKKRNIADAVYAKSNPSGDPFKVKMILTKDEELLKYLALGLYWGEGNKKICTASGLAIQTH